MSFHGLYTVSQHFTFIIVKFTTYQLQLTNKSKTSIINCKDNKIIDIRKRLRGFFSQKCLCILNRSCIFAAELEMSNE